MIEQMIFRQPLRTGFPQPLLLLRVALDELLRAELRIPGPVGLQIPLVERR
jgi:hypothetical protein